MNVVLFPEVLAKVARLPGFRLEAEGQTLREVINHLCTRHTDLRAHLFYENDKLKEHFLFTSAGELVDPDRDLQEGSEIDIMLATSGGTCVEQLSNDEVRRYVRHITLPEVGREGQLRLKNAKVLIIGTGGLGSPASLYLAAAGVGTLGLIDFDVVESSNLQRQVVHGISTLGMPKVESAKRRLQDLNETITINTYNAALDADNALSLIGQYDLVVDGTDNFSTRYLVNDACARLRKPLVYGAIYRFDGQMSVFNHGEGPCYRCLFPNSPPPELAPNCSAGGVIGVLPGVVGLIQATEALKLILQIGEPLVGRLMRFDAMAMKFSEVRFKRRADCRACSPLYADAPLSTSELVCSNAPPTQTPLAANFFIEPLALKQMMESGSDDCVLVDVRDANELEVCKLPGAIHIPLIELEGRVSELNRDRSHYLVCHGGMRAERAANTLLGAGFVRTQVLQGGMKRWVRDVEPDMPIY